MKFIFDLDGTVTQVETLPYIAAHFGISDEIATLTHATVSGEIPFVESLSHRVEILGRRSVSTINALLSDAPLFPNIAAFIRKNSQDCVVATGNLDVWTQGLATRIGCAFSCSRASVANDQITKIENILCKEEVVAAARANGDVTVYIGDGHNDAAAMGSADFSIAAGMVHEPAESVLEVCDWVVYSEAALLARLNDIQADPHLRGKFCQLRIP